MCSLGKLVERDLSLFGSLSVMLHSFDCHQTVLLQSKQRKLRRLDFDLLLDVIIHGERIIKTCV